MGSRRSSTLPVSGDGDRRELNSILASDGPFLFPEVDRLTSGGRCVRAGRRTFFVCGALSVARENLALTKRSQPGSGAHREGSKRLPCLVAFHPQKMEQTHGKNFGIEYAQK